MIFLFVVYLKFKIMEKKNLLKVILTIIKYAVTLILGMISGEPVANLLSSL